MMVWQKLHKRVYVKSGSDDEKRLASLFENVEKKRARSKVQLRLARTCHSRLLPVSGLGV